MIALDKNWIGPVTLTGRYATLTPLSQDHALDLEIAVAGGELSQVRVPQYAADLGRAWPWYWRPAG